MVFRLSFPRFVRKFPVFRVSCGIFRLSSSFSEFRAGKNPGKLSEIGLFFKYFGQNFKYFGQNWSVRRIFGWRVVFFFCAFCRFSVRFAVFLCVFSCVVRLTCVPVRYCARMVRRAIKNAPNFGRSRRNWGGNWPYSCGILRGIDVSATNLKRKLALFVRNFARNWRFQCEF